MSLAARTILHGVAYGALVMLIASSLLEKLSWKARNFFLLFILHKLHNLKFYVICAIIYNISS